MVADQIHQRDINCRMHQLIRSPGKSAVFICNEAVVYIWEIVRVLRLESSVAPAIQDRRDGVQNRLEADVAWQITIEVATSLQEVLLTSSFERSTNRFMSCNS